MGNKQKFERLVASNSLKIVQKRVSICFTIVCLIIILKYHYKLSFKIYFIDSTSCYHSTGLGIYMQVLSTSKFFELLMLLYFHVFMYLHKINEGTYEIKCYYHQQAIIPTIKRLAVILSIFMVFNVLMKSK